MGRDLGKSWLIGVGITLFLYLLVRVGQNTPLVLGSFFFFPFVVAAESLAYMIAGGTRAETFTFVCFAILLGGIYYGVIAFIVIRFRSRRQLKKQA